MKTIIIGALALWLVAGPALYAQEGKLPPLIDREIFFGNPEIAAGKLSPDGNFISFVKPNKGTLNIWVKKFNEPFDAARPLTAETQRPVTQYFWSRDSKKVLYVKDIGGDENYNLYAVDPNAAMDKESVPENKDLTNLKGVRVMIFGIPRNEPNTVYIGLNDRDPAWHDLYKLNINTGERILIKQNSGEERITGYVFDWDDKLRLATRANQDGSNDILRVDNDKLVSIYTTNIFETAYPLEFDKDNKKVYLITNKGNDRDLMQLVLLDPVTLKEELVDKDPLNKVDIGSAGFSEVTRELTYTTYEDEKTRIVWKDQALKQDYEVIRKQFEGHEIALVNATNDEQKFLVIPYSDTDPGSTYIYDRQTKKLIYQYTPRPNLPIKDLATMQPIQYKSSDGLMIPAYLTIPKGLEPKNLPLVVMPHGGPWGRDSWGYFSYVQFLANRGYAVLLPNFRASTGYGKAFLNAGNKEWGQKMQDDITWGVKYLIEQGIADPEKVGIMGGSYGGYATLAGLAFTPDVYKCGVSIVGPSNLLTLLNSIPPYWESIRTIFYERMGNPDTPEGKAQLERQSPLNSATKIKSPLLVIQGANDPRVNIHESDQIVVALRDRGADVEYLVAPDEGHGFARPVNNMAMLAAAEKFLAKHLGGRYQESATPEVSARLKEITVDVKTVKLSNKTPIN